MDNKKTDYFKLTRYSMVYVIDRETGDVLEEKVYGSWAIQLLYGKSLISRCFGPFFRWIFSWPVFSKLFGWYQSQRWTGRNVFPFIKKYGIDASEFQEEPKAFSSFNAFFIRKLKSECRPLNPGALVMPVDGRYRFFPRIDQASGYYLKGQRFDLESLLLCKVRAERYAKGSMVIARLAPVDCHRFYFPCHCHAGQAEQVNGYLYSVNPLALRRNIHIFTENKRYLTVLQSPEFGEIIYMEVGATNVGSVHQTYKPGHFYSKGSEKGYFSFGGSSIVLLFEENRLEISPELIRSDDDFTEIRCLIGQYLGLAKNTRP